MPSPKSRPLAFSITIIPEERGRFTVLTEPSHPMLEETVEAVMRGRVAISTDRSTVITAPIDGPMKARSSGRIGPTRVRMGLLQLAEVGGEELRAANNIVIGYLYDAVVCAVLVELEKRGATAGSHPYVTLDDGPIPQFRTTTHSWWRDVRHVVLPHDGGALIRLRGIPRTETFAYWGNARILSNFRRRLASSLGVPVSTIGARNLREAV